VLAAVKAPLALRGGYAGLDARCALPRHSVYAVRRDSPEGAHLFVRVLVPKRRRALDGTFQDRQPILQRANVKLQLGHSLLDGPFWKQRRGSYRTNAAGQENARERRQSRNENSVLQHGIQPPRGRLTRSNHWSPRATSPEQKQAQSAADRYLPGAQITFSCHNNERAEGANFHRETGHF
jgi:hypothetical protein